MGDFNEDEATNGRKGPVEWLARAAVTGGTDGTDKDRSDAMWDAAQNPFNGSTTTTSSGKLDYIVYQDSAFTLRRSFVFYSAPMSAGWMPPEFAGFAAGGNAVSGTASDHSPVIVDAILPAESVLTPPPAFSLLTPAPGAMHVPVDASFQWEPAATANTYTCQVFDDPALLVPIYTAIGLLSPAAKPPAGTLEECKTYFWRVFAVNQAGVTLGTPGVSVFETIRPADMNMDGVYDFFDFLAFQDLFNLMDPRADFDKNGVLDFFDFLAFQNAFVANC